MICFSRALVAFSAAFSSADLLGALALGLMEQVREVRRYNYGIPVRGLTPRSVRAVAVRGVTNEEIKTSMYRYRLRFVSCETRLRSSSYQYQYGSTVPACMHTHAARFQQSWQFVATPVSPGPSQHFDLVQGTVRSVVDGFHIHPVFHPVDASTPSKPRP